ncbi:MAG: hypothetical protein ACLR1T_14230 [Evtepia gabavorous]
METAGPENRPQRPNVPTKGEARGPRVPRLFEGAPGVSAPMEQGALPDKKTGRAGTRSKGYDDAAGCQVVAVGAGPWRKERPTTVPVLLGGEGLPAAACRILCARRTMCALAGALSSQRLTRKE